MRFFVSLSLVSLIYFVATSVASGTNKEELDFNLTTATSNIPCISAFSKETNPSNQTQDLSLTPHLTTSNSYQVNLDPTLDLKSKEVIKSVSDNTSTYTLYKDGSVQRSSGLPETSFSKIAYLLTKDVKEIYQADGLFIALREDGRVIAWGDSSKVKEFEDISDKLSKGVKKIVHTRNAFAALTKEGTVVTWGNASTGGDSSSISNKLTRTKEIYANKAGFCAVTYEGIISWGDSIVQSTFAKISSKLPWNADGKFIATTDTAFAFFKFGKVFTWGDPSNGGDSSKVKDQLSDIKTIYSNEGAFVAVGKNNTTVGWGNPDSLKPLLAEVEEKIRLSTTVIKTIDLGENGLTLYADGRVTVRTPVYYSPYYFSNYTHELEMELHDIIDVKNTQKAIAALRSDGRVFVWGNSSYGGDSYVAKKLVDVKEIYSNRQAFVAVRNDGTTVGWGNKWDVEDLIEEVNKKIANNNNSSTKKDP